MFNTRVSIVDEHRPLLRHNRLADSERRDAVRVQEEEHFVPPRERSGPSARRRRRSTTPSGTSWSPSFPSPPASFLTFPLFPSRTHQFITVSYTPANKTKQTNSSRRTKLTPWSTIPQLLECHGNLPPPHTLGNAQATAFASLLDWCLRGPAQCRCVYHASTRTYDVDCAMDDNRLDTAPGIVACHNQCDCGQFIDRPTLERMASGALQLGRGRTGLA